MARHPTAKARVLGADLKNPQRYRGRNDPTCAAIGDPSPLLTDGQREAWEKFTAEIPWLVASDRALLEIASILRARIADPGEIGINQLQVYSAVLSKLGATPVDRSRVMLADDEDEEDEFFGRRPS